jgi:hypothetical protein
VSRKQEAPWLPWGPLPSPITSTPTSVASPSSR